MDAFRDHYVPTGHDLRDPLLSPLFGRLDGLPPALVQTADLDPIRDDGIRYADALRAAGVPVRLTNYLEVPHGFAFMPGAAPAVGRQQRWELASRAHRRARPPTTADRLRTCARSSCSPGRPTPPSPTGSATSWG